MINIDEKLYFYLQKNVNKCINNKLISRKLFSTEVRKKYIENAVFTKQILFINIILQV